MSIRYKAEAVVELLRRYKEVIGYFWGKRKSLDLPDLKPQESEFLPAALSLQTKPVSPAGRWVARILMLLVLFVLAWSFIGKVDIIVSSSGKIIPVGQPKIIGSIEVAKVVGLYVREGQKVRKGDVLVELDTRTIDSDREKAELEKQLSQLQIARARALIMAIDTNHAPVFPVIEGVTSEQQQQAQRHLRGQWDDYIARRTRLHSEIKRLERTIPLLKQRADDYKELLETGDVPSHGWAERAQVLVEAQGQLVDIQNQMSILETETRKSAQDSLHEGTRLFNNALEESIKAKAHGEQLTLTSPIDGTVQQLSVNTLGGVVPAAQGLMQIVPDRAPLEVDAVLENKDVGFVHEGQTAEVKIEALEYTKYGTIPAHVVHISRNSIDDEKRGPIYTVRIALHRSYLMVNGKPVNLSTGMSVVAEIKTGTRRIIEYVLSPLIRYTHESLHER